jgi:hypothetical protein
LTYLVCAISQGAEINREDEIMTLATFTVAVVAAQWKREFGNKARSAVTDKALAAWGRWTSRVAK